MLKAKKTSLIEITTTYANDEDACRQFFFHAKHPNGWVCPACGCREYRLIRRGNMYECRHCSYHEHLFAGTPFQDNKLPLYKLLLGIFLFFSANKGLSAVEMRNHLNVNIKTAQLLCRKCRHLMSIEESKEKLNSLFYEADGAFIGAASKEPGHQGSGTTQQSFMAVLSTGEENKYPHQLKLIPIKTDDSETTERVMKEVAELGPEKKLNTDGKSTFNVMRKYMQVESEKVDYDDPKHRLHWLNILIGNVKTQITGIYHGVCKRDLPLFLSEQAFRYNHAKIGNHLMEKISDMLGQSGPCTRKQIMIELDVATATFIKA